MIRKSSWFAIVAASVASIASAVDPPVVQQGECLWLLGAPAGAPAAATEVAYSGTRVYDTCTHIPHVEVGRDAPNRLTVWQEFVSPGAGPSGCVTKAYSEHGFVLDGDQPSLLLVAGAGDVSGLLTGRGSFFDNAAEMSLDFQVIQIGADGGERVIATRRVLERASRSSIELHAQDRWAATLAASVPGQGTFRARLMLEIRTERAFSQADAGSPGSGRGASYESLEICVVSSDGSGSASADEIERDLYEKRCMASLWLPASQGGRLDDAFDVVGGLLLSAQASGELGANLRLAGDRFARAQTERSQEQYQRACRSLSDSVRALTTP